MILGGFLNATAAGITLCMKNYSSTHPFSVLPASLEDILFPDIISRYFFGIFKIISSGPYLIQKGNKLVLINALSDVLWDGVHNI